LNPADEKEMACKELVDVLTDYLDGNLPPDDRQRLEAHLDECPYCVDYLAQMKETVDALGGVNLEPLAPERQEVVLEAFRGWQDRNGRNA
jgi:anti-sigma factor (TIGR02949 family)